MALALVLCASVTGDVVAQQAPSTTLRPADAVFNVPDGQFTAITSIRELNNGQVLVADRIENRIALVDLVKKQSTPISRAGDGPGEYRGIGWLVPLGNDSSLLIDPLSRRWIIFDGAKPVETIPPDRAIIRNTGVVLAGADRGDQVLGIVGLSHSTPMPPMRENADSLAVVLMRRSTAIGDTIARIAGRGSAGLCITVRGTPRAGARRPPACNRLATEDMALLFADGWVAIAMAEPYRVDWRDPLGRWTRGPDLANDRAPLNDEDKCDFLGSRSGLGMARTCDLSQYAWPRILPAFQSYRYLGAVAPLSPPALAAPDGKLVIRRLMKPSSSQSQYDVIDRSGRLVGTIALPRNESIVGFGVRSVYVAETTETGLQLLRRHPWP